MVDAVSLSANGFRVAGLRPAQQMRPVVATPATLAPAPAVSPVPQASTVEEIGDLDFLYAPGGQPEGGGGRLAVTSDRLTALLTSLMQPAAAAETADAAPAPQTAAGPSVITRLYSQF